MREWEWEENTFSHSFRSFAFLPSLILALFVANGSGCADFLLTFVGNAGHLLVRMKRDLESRTVLKG